MKKRYVSAVLSALLYTQGLLGFAALAAALMHGSADAAVLHALATSGAR